jgi:hypothetical protein
MKTSIHITLVFILSLASMVPVSVAVGDSKEIQSLSERIWPRARNFIAGMASGVGLVLAGSNDVITIQ